ncbi:MAG: NUDIX hydrolase, partial [Gammaproteobacteria bacterium]|nr:NUDIX hydrolase [Gammaproteobacteria bacterium]
MMDKQPEFKGKIIEVEVRHVTLPNGHQMEMEVVRHPGGAAVAALNERQEICLLKQYRCVFDEWLWELPAGKRDHQEPPLATAQRELAEEAGVIAGQWTELG